MLLTSKETAQRLEEAVMGHTKHLIEACTRFFPNTSSSTTAVGGGVASLSLPAFGRKLNRIEGFGLQGPVFEEDLAAIEDRYTQNGVEILNCLCPHAHPSALRLLTSRDYRVDAFINSYARILTDEDLEEVLVEGVEIRRISNKEASEFPHWSVAGFKSGGDSELLLDTLARSAVLGDSTLLYYAVVDGRIAASAGMAIIQTSKGAVAFLHIDSTLPEYRGRGLQSALLKARLVDARRAGLDLATAQARCGDGSCRNIERAGFSIAYTRIWFVKGIA